MLGNLKAAIKLINLIVWTGFWFILLTLAYKLKKWTFRDHVMRWASIGILKIIGIKVKVTGQPSDIRPLLLASNHISYLDVVILNACDHIHFTPKSDIDSWPVARHIARMSGGVYIDRRAEKLPEGKDNIISTLAEGNMVCLFPEGTTGNGLHMKPFKSGFFSLAEEKIHGHELTIQPIAITYSAIRHLPIDTTQWPLVAWYGDMELLPHLWHVLKIAPIDAEVVFLSSVTIHECGDRKKLAAHCQKVIGEAIQTIRGQRRHAHVKSTQK